MIIRNFQNTDAGAIRTIRYPHLSEQEIQYLIAEWNQKQFNGRYFEMFAIISGEAMRTDNT